MEKGFFRNGLQYTIKIYKFYHKNLWEAKPEYIVRSQS